MTVESLKAHAAALAPKSNITFIIGGGLHDGDEPLVNQPEELTRFIEFARTKGVSVTIRIDGR